MNKKILVILISLAIGIINVSSAATQAPINLLDALKKRMGQVRAAVDGDEADEENWDDPVEQTEPVKDIVHVGNAALKNRNDAISRLFGTSKKQAVEQVTPMGKSKFKEMQAALLKSKMPANNNNTQKKACEEKTQIMPEKNILNKVRLILEFLGFKQEWNGNKFLLTNALNLNEKNAIRLQVIKNLTLDQSTKMVADVLKSILELLPNRFFETTKTAKTLQPEMTNLIKLLPNDDFYVNNDVLISKLLNLIDSNDELLASTKELAKNIKSGLKVILSLNRKL